MPKQYDNNNKGALFANDKGDNAKRPDWRGEATVAGVKYWVSAWQHEVRSGDRAGEEYLSLSFQVAEDKPKAQEPDSTIPF